MNESVLVYRVEFLGCLLCLWPRDLHANKQLRNNELLLQSQLLGTDFSQIFSQRFSMAAERREICHPSFLSQTFRVDNTEG